eukprot:4296906-Prymnesium_polylepis.1
MGTSTWDVSCDGSWVSLDLTLSGVPPPAPPAPPMPPLLPGGLFTVTTMTELRTLVAATPPL